MRLAILALLALSACATPPARPNAPVQECILSHAYRDVTTGEITCGFGP
ncbi:MAG TPA: hypothetical protein VNU68_35190 [Verrucomicrobiae bacterium]|nr:hypothetical protein [Verrucomicrobiae bacterium]